MAEYPSLLPTITEADVDWVCRLMDLDIDRPRRDFLLANETLDVSACPGSGKTTLIVAKLAILARKWPYRTRGICVLSHTNVARQQVENRLGDTVAGQSLLRYPHFIDTIHGFTNRFLALPWLRSNHFSSPTIDDDVTTNFRRGVLGRRYWTIHKYLENQGSGFDRLRICAPDLSFDLSGRKFLAGPDTESFKLAREAIQAGFKAGYFCYDEMFVWAHRLLNESPSVAACLRHRFPLLLVDEVQDTSEVQGRLLVAVFPRGCSESVVQRVGDPNQAIFEDFGAQDDTSDPFPDLKRCLDIPNSYRFGSTIASLASPFAVSPVGTAGLRGIGPRLAAEAQTEFPHAIFVFDDCCTDGVLDCFGHHVLAVFGDSTLEGRTIAAVGAVHQDCPDVAPGDPQYPKSVPHYWSGYKAEFSRMQLYPKSLVEYFLSAKVAAHNDRGNLHSGVEKIAAGIIRLANTIGDVGLLRRRERTHRAIVAALESKSKPLRIYHHLLRFLLIDCNDLSEDVWTDLQRHILGIAEALCNGEVNYRRASDFLAWPLKAEAASPPPVTEDEPTSNSYPVKAEGRRVDIRLGSIHSVKGQNHLATMILSTYWHQHSSLRILPWLLGKKMSGHGVGVQDRRRLLQTYVAMTRPSHMVCIAMPRSTLGQDRVFAENVNILIGRGWRVAEIVNGSASWWE